MPVTVTVRASVGRVASRTTSSRSSAQVLGEAVAPLDDRDAVVDVGVEVEVVELEGAAEPVGVDVHQGRATDERGVHPGDDEGRRGDRPADAQPVADPLGQGRLPGAQATGEHDEVAGAQQPARAAPKPGCPRPWPG